MNELVVNGKKYVKATEIAKDLGYTSDYVGQLCRAGKVDAQRLGRSWYVVPDSIHQHKQSRYRQNQAKSKAAAAAYREARARRGRGQPTAPQRTQHVHVQSYERDDSELWPVPGKGRAAAETEDSAEAEVSVKTVTPPSHFAPSEKPKIRFTGSVAVASAENTTVETDNVSLEPTAEQPTPTRPAVPQLHGQRRLVRKITDTRSAEQPVQITRNTATKPRARSWLLITVTVCTSLGLVVTVLGTSVTTNYSNGSVSRSVTFSWANVSENINKYMDISFKREL